jgi:hypothetical protein
VITEATTRQCALELEALPSRIQQVRRIVAAQLRYWRLEPLLDNTLLGITELLANVHRHARPDKRCQVELTFASGWLTVAVTDSDPRLPRVREFEPLATCGRGLAMVVSMSDSWGTEAVSDGGKVVWFTLRAEAPAPRPALAVPLSVVVREAIRRAPDAMASAPVREPIRKPVREPVREPIREPAKKPVRVREIALV